MKYQGKHLYLYIGWNGILVSLDFDYKEHAHNIEFSFMWCRFKLNGSDVWR
jgi:hypothetical protein